MDFSAYLPLIGFLILVLVVNWVVPVILLIRARWTGLELDPFSLIGMRLRNVPPHLIVGSAIAASRGGIPISMNELEAHHLAGGNPARVVRALLMAKEAGSSLNFSQAAAIDLSGRDVLEYCRSLPKKKER
ncbi:flotillin-like FloA family protein [Candidatus Ozemobacteraceae bacterium]|nr:flotillin-like FloA family protein [Candidatus Ozemobacteraceae bacterium]OQA08361.1 MAG: SigmaW regulon antibacterial [bacterium ADurb.Bin374]